MRSNAPCWCAPARPLPELRIDMPVSPGYRAFVVEQLERLVPITTRSMFGGVGIYSDGVFFAVMDDDQLFFKTDDGNRGRYQDAGMPPFQPMGPDKPMQYHRVPPELLDEPDRLRPWMEAAIAVARRKKRKKG